MMSNYIDFNVEISWLYFDIRHAVDGELWLLDAASYMLSAGTLARIGYADGRWDWGNIIDKHRLRLLDEAENG